MYFSPRLKHKTAAIRGGCQLAQNFLSWFVKTSQVTLVMAWVWTPRPTLVSYDPVYVCVIDVIVICNKIVIIIVCSTSVQCCGAVVWETGMASSLQTPLTKTQLFHFLTTGPRTYISFRDRSFSIAGPRVWNALPSSLQQDISYGQFNWQLKTFLF